METLLSKRYKYLIPLGAGILFLVISGIYLLAARNTHISDINEAVLSRIGMQETALKERIEEVTGRAAFIYSKYQDNSLLDSQLRSGESLILVKSNRIVRYYGEIYHFKYVSMPPSQWVFLKRGNAVYFMKKMADNTFYLSNFLDIEDNFILKPWDQSLYISELKFIDPSIGFIKNDYNYDENKETFFYNQLLKFSNNQLVLHIKFSRKDYNAYTRHRALHLFLIVLLALLLMGIVVIFKERKSLVWPFRLLWTGVGIILYVLANLTVEQNLYFNFLGLQFHLLTEILILLLVVAGFFYLLHRRYTSAWLAMAVFHTMAVGSIFVCRRILAAVDLNITEFSLTFDYLVLLLVLLLLHLIPVLGLIFSKKLRAKMVVATALLVQAALVWPLFRSSLVNVLPYLLFVLLYWLLVYAKRRFILSVLVVFIFSFSVFSFLSQHARLEKDTFIEDNLQRVFLNQDNYAKFIADEIIKVINSNYKYIHEFFQNATNAELRDIWHSSLAARENIASGIYIISKEGEVLQQFSYQIPYLNVESKNIFPFWSYGDATADFHGKKISLALASIDVFEKSRNLGQIIIQVQNTPELILRYKDEINIFTINQQIKGMDISYIKLNEEEQIVENPANITIKNISRMLAHTNQWVKFRYMDLNFKGYIFKQKNRSTVIFYPENTLAKNFSEMIKIFLFFMILLLLVNFNKLPEIEWKSIYYSYSFRVFSLLIIISLFTAIIFSIFSLNFTANSSQRRLRKFIYERGRSAQNYILNLLENEGEIDQNLIFLLSKIYDTDVSVFRNGEWLATSNFKKVINSQVPTHLHSDILSQLNTNNQEFVLNRAGEGFNLYFKARDYIFNIDYSTRSQHDLSVKGSYSDFIFTLFFVLTVIGLSLAFFFRNKIMSPIFGLNLGMAAVEKGKLTQLENIPAETELKSLFLGFNKMVEGIREQRKKDAEISRIKTLVKLGRRVAHEVKNPLTPIKLSAEQILRSINDKGSDYENIIRQSVNYIVDETEHLRRVSLGFLDLSRLDEINVQLFDLVRLIEEEILNFKQIYTNIDFTLNCSEDTLQVHLDRIKIKQVIKNLLINSIEAIGEKKGRILITVNAEGRGIKIAISDNGVGLSKRELDMIFREDYSLKESGTGLGLFIVKRIVDLHKGEIEFKSRKALGTTVTLLLPGCLEENQ